MFFWYYRGDIKTKGSGLFFCVDLVQRGATVSQGCRTLLQPWRSFCLLWKSPLWHGDVTRITNVLLFSSVLLFAAWLDDGHVYDHIGAYVNFCFVCNLLKKAEKKWFPLSALSI